MRIDRETVGTKGRRAAILSAVIGALVWSLVGRAHAQSIPPVSVGPPFAPLASPSVTLTIMQGVANVTGSWLPEPGQPVTLVVNVSGVPDPTATIVLVCPDGSVTSPCPTPAAAVNPIAGRVLVTSAYPGQCTNFDNPAASAFIPDFTFDPLTKTLTPTDCGGVAVVRVTTATGSVTTHVLPQDSNFNGLPDLWEARYCPPGTSPAGCPLAPAGDGDLPPVNLAGSPTGDGIAAFDEYRGFIVSGLHVRTNPLQKNLFVHLQNPQCTTAAGSATSLFQTYPVDEAPNAGLTLSATTGGGVTFRASAAVFNPSHVGANIVVGGDVKGTISTLVNTTTVTVNVASPFASTSIAAGAWAIRPSLFGNLNNLVSGTQIHILGFAPRSANGTTTEWVDRFSRYTEAAGFEYVNPDGTPTTTAPADDRQINKHAVYPMTDPLTGPIQKGLRITECLDESATSPLGVAGRGSPNGPVNALLYTKRIVNSMTNAINAGAGKPLKYSTFFNGGWQTPVDTTAQVLISKAMLYYLAMEVGHAVQLTSTIIMGSGGTTYGYHYAPNSGDNLDQNLTTRVSSRANTFWIPSLYNTAGQGSFKAKN